MFRSVIGLSLFFAACSAPEEAALPVDVTPPPAALGWDFPGYLIKGSPSTISVTGGPGAGTAAFLISTAAGGAPACPAALAPDCLGIPNPITVVATRPFAAGAAAFNVTVPVALPATQVWLQIAGVQGPAHFLTPAIRAQLLDPAGDFDGDGLANQAEASVHATSPLVADTDGDGLVDGEELREATDPLDPDTDDDGLDDGDEVSLFGTNPLSADSDGDTLLDGVEVSIGTNPLAVDTDGDALSDLQEQIVGSNPLLFDTDSDGLIDGQETTIGTNPTVADTDGDGLTDGEEPMIGTNPTLFDTDADGLGDGEEVLLGTNPTQVDTDADGLNDAEELPLGTNPTVADTDADGLTDGAEVNTHLTDPLDPDTDGGTVADGAEIANGTDPLNAADDVPPPPPTFQADILPRISRVRCAGCHTNGGASGGFNQEVYANWLAPAVQLPSMRRILPGDPARSYVWHKVNNTQASVGGTGLRMPRGGAALSPADLALLQEWILAGAPEF